MLTALIDACYNLAFDIYEWTRKRSEPLRRLWIETHPLTKTLCKVMVPIGVIMVAGGVWGEAAGFWDGYLTNLLSSLTGLMFAVPFALVIISRLADTHEKFAAQQGVKHATWDSYQHLLRTIGSLEHSFQHGTGREFGSAGSYVFIRQACKDIDMLARQLSGPIRRMRIDAGLSWLTEESERLVFDYLEGEILGFFTPHDRNAFGSAYDQIRDPDGMGRESARRMVAEGHAASMLSPLFDLVMADKHEKWDKESPYGRF